MGKTELPDFPTDANILADLSRIEVFSEKF